MSVQINISDEVWTAFSHRHPGDDPTRIAERLLREDARLPPYDAATLREDQRRFDEACRPGGATPHQDVMARAQSQLATRPQAGADTDDHPEAG